MRVLRSPAAGDLKIMIAGHTDNQSIAGPQLREQYPNNFHLSTARALAVADRMKQAGLPEQRLGVAGFGPYQPIASNTTAQDRQKNRRVEIFVMASDVPVVGWTRVDPQRVRRGRPAIGGRRRNGSRLLPCAFLTMVCHCSAQARSECGLSDALLLRDDLRELDATGNGCRRRLQTPNAAAFGTKSATGVASYMSDSGTPAVRSSGTLLWAFPCVLRNVG